MSDDQRFYTKGGTYEVIDTSKDRNGRAKSRSKKGSVVEHHYHEPTSRPYYKPDYAAKLYFKELRKDRERALIAITAISTFVITVVLGRLGIVN